MNEKKTRKRYTKEEKLIVLKEYSVFKKPKKAFEKLNIDLDNLSDDKKYFSKLINKWKKEFPEFKGEKQIRKELEEDFIMKDYLDFKKKKEKE